MRDTAGWGLFTDLYQLTMGQSYFNEGMHDNATFSLFFRHLPPGWGYLIAAGLDDVLRYLETVTFTAEDLDYLQTTGRFTAEFLDYLAKLRFTGSVRAMPEGTFVFPDEPLLEITAPIIEAQIVETFVLNQVHFQTLVAGKAARCVDVAAGRHLSDFGLRRTHGSDAGMKASRSSYLAGFDSTSNVLAGARYGIPIVGTMAHSYVESFPDEITAFRAYARAYPDTCVLLLDTYDTLAGAAKAITVARELAARGHRLAGVRLDSGDLLALSKAVRGMLDAAGFTDTRIVASGGLDERDVSALLSAGAPIDIFGVGTRMGTSADAPYLDMAYKLVSYGGKPRLKLSAGKATWPGQKQVWRVMAGGQAVADVIGLAEEPGPDGADPLLQPVMRHGRRLQAESLSQARQRAAQQRAVMPPAIRTLDVTEGYPVRFSAGLEQMRHEAEARARGE
jgi:nicotinate phosphoribosyltransferase